MKQQEKSTMGFMILTGSPMPMFLIAALVNTSQINRLIIVFVPVILGICIMFAFGKENKN